DGKIQVNSELLVAVDANGRLLIKVAGTALQVTVPSGTNQLYAYFLEDETDLAKRRFIPVTSPFTEFSRAIDTTFTGDVDLYVRAGNATTIVKEDVVNGFTRALVFLGVVTNTAGTVTFDASAAASRLSTIHPFTAPASSHANGTMKTLHDLVQEIAYLLSQAKWAGEDSAHFNPTQANNWGTYQNLPALGIAATSRRVFEYVTIGDGSSTFGVLDQSDFSDDSTLLTAAVALIGGAGVIVLKPGVQLTNFPSSVSIPADVTVTIQGTGIN